ncbi:MAG TPA: ferritin family protein [Thermoanaerobaculia bacterium]|nr:ferritin family protein [Thermoanaerobaculia bacterium]
MSRLPRHLEHLRTGSTAEATSAASYRAYAEHAEAAGKPNLGSRWRSLAAEKDRLAIELLRAAGKVESDHANLRDAIATEQYENEVLYPRMIGDMEDLGQADEAALLRRLVETQRRHQAELDDLRRELTASTRDVRGPAVAKAG